MGGVRGHLRLAVNELDGSWPTSQTPLYLVYLKAPYALYSSDVGPAQLPLQPRRDQLANFSSPL